jgi:hypothetical protein
MGQTSNLLINDLPKIQEFLEQNPNSLETSNKGIALNTLF